MVEFWDLLDAAVRGALIALLLLLALRLWRARLAGSVGALGAALALGLCVQALSSAPAFEGQVLRLWQAPFVAVSVANAVLFWLFARALFDDDFRVRPVHGLIWLAAAGLSALNCAWLAPLAAHWTPAAVSVAVQRGLPLLFGGLACVAALAHWRADLVERRRRLRAFIVGAGCVYIVFTVVARLQSPQGRLSSAEAGLDVLGLLFIVAVLAAQMLSLKPSAVLPSPCVPAITPVLAKAEHAAQQEAVADPAEVAQLLQLMQVERFYREEDLTLARLAERLAMPEYRLRRLINQGLGHRNFNSFVNSFRLAEAQAGLSDPTRQALPILSIALEAGFQSIGPFNRAFKAATGLTPSEFRRQQLADS